MRKSDIKFEYTRGQGPGGQHKNKTDSCVKATHIPSGLSVTIDGRKQGQNKREAVNQLRRLLDDHAEAEKAHAKKQRRDQKIKERDIIRTYNYSRGTVKDHRSRKTASLKQVMEKGRIDLLHDD